jgi:RNA polymerase sigma factor (sigma-70 family)
MAPEAPGRPAVNASILTSDSELLQRLADRHPEAWHTVVDRYERLLVMTASRYGLDQHQRADVIQTTWLRLLENANQIRCAEALGGWLATTVAREALLVIRRTGRELPAPVPDRCSPDQVDVDDTLDAQARATRLRLAIATLPPRERELITVLLDPRGPSYHEVSRRLEMPIGAIGPVRQRALRRLRAALSTDLDHAFAS